MVPRPQLTGRAAVLAIVMCAIAMSLAYPVREYIGQRRQIAQLERQEQAARRDVEQLQQRKRQLEDPNYVKREAKRRLHYCEPGEKCYVLVGGPQQNQNGPQVPADEQRPWYQSLWQSVQAADGGAVQPPPQ